MRYIYCHPLFDERKCAHRFSFQLKTEFQAADLTLERFDYYGTGEAGGDFSEISLQSLQEDIAAEVADDRVCLIGLRLGASVVFDYCVHNSGQVEKLILLQPVVNGADYIDYLYRKQHIKDMMTDRAITKLEDKGYRNIEGYKTSVNFIEQIKKLDLLELVKGYKANNSIYVVQISNRSTIDPRISCLRKSLQNLTSKFCLENIVLPTFWERIPSVDYAKLTEKILGWCCD
ncbi:hypothetical protein ACFL3G_05510 [Planctomycetota bacterium]